MRLFVGVGVSEEVRREAERVSSALRRRIGTGVGARWVPPENHHLTIRFIGHAVDERVAGLLDALDRPLATPAFDIELSGCGRFPPRGGPRVVWIGVSRGLDLLRLLHQEFTRRVAPFGYEPDNRPFSAHLTLARIKDAPGGAGRLLDEALASISVLPIVQPINRVTIFESVLSPKGPRYASLRELPLQTT